MTETVFCEKCLSEIPFGNPYYAIVRSLEFRCLNEETSKEEIEVEDAEEIIRLCKSCGSQFNKTALEIIVKHLPIAGQELNN